MANFLDLLNESFDNKYSFLRIKSVEMNLKERKIATIFYVPYDLFDTFDVEMQQEISVLLHNQLSDFDVSISYEKLMPDIKVIESRLKDYIAKRFPFIFSGIAEEGIIVTSSDVLVINIYAVHGIHEYADSVGFENIINDFISTKFCLDSIIYWQLGTEPDYDFKGPRPDSRSTLIPISERKLIAGKKSEIERDFPIHISTVKMELDNVMVCGKVSRFELKNFGEVAVDKQEESSGLSEEEKILEGEKKIKEKKTKRKRYRYSFILNDTTSSIKINYYADEKIPALDDIQEGECLFVKGRSKYNEFFDTYSIFATLIGFCIIDFDTLKEQLKKFPPPDNYTIIQPGKFEYEEIEQLDLIGESEEQEEKEIKKEEPFCALYISYANENDDGKCSPYELSAVIYENGQMSSYLHTYIKTSDVDSLPVNIKDNVFIAPRFSDIIPDVLKFIQGYQVLTIQDEDWKFLIEECEHTRYELPTPFKNIVLLGAKKDEEDKSYIERCHEKKIKIDYTSGGFTYAKSIINFYNSVKKKK